MTRNNLIFNAGIPTEPDVKALMESFKDLSEGVVVTNADIEAVIGVKQTTNRFKTVVMAWRKRLDRDLNILMKAESGTLRVMTPSERIELAGGKNKHGFRSIAKSAKIAVRTDSVKLTLHEQRAQDHFIRCAAAITLAAAIEAKKTKALTGDVKRNTDKQ